MTGGIADAAAGFAARSPTGTASSQRRRQGKNRE